MSLSGNKARCLMAVALIVAILISDQVVKIWVKTNMTLHQTIPIFSWFQIVFIENNGMAYGLELGSKLVLSLLRLILIVVISIYIVRKIKDGSPITFILCLAMIVAGAAGNVIDGMFYGLIFSQSTPIHVAHLVPFGHGYEEFMKGRVVDMLYFPIISFTFPSWFPMLSGKEFLFFRPVFNIADASITSGVFLLLLFFRKNIAESTLDLSLFRLKKRSAGEGHDDEKT